MSRVALPQKREIVTAIPGPKSVALAARRKAAVGAGVGATVPVFAEAANGGVVRDVDGNVFIDLAAGIAVTNVGSSAPLVVDAVQEQVAAFTHTCFTVTAYEPYVAVCEELNRLTPGDFEKRSALFNSGAEAVENAIKIARSYTRRQMVVAFEHAFHGRTNLTMSLTAKNMPYKNNFGPFAPEVYRVPFSYPYRDGGRSGAEAAAEAILRIEKECGGANVAAVIVEPIQGEGGFIVPADGFLAAIADYCKANGIVFIADEIQSGFARTGEWFAIEHEGVVPDMITSAKGIAGGLPLSAVTGRAEIMDAVHAGGIGGTYGGNPLACAAALATIRTVEQEGFLQRAKEIEVLMRARLEAIAATHGVIGEIRGRGAMLAIEFVKPGTTEVDAAITAKVAAYCHQHGVLVLTAGTYGNVIRFLPPLAISDALLDDALDVLDAAIAASR